jgi:AGCS family alanine or glycine:cation symporter
MIDSLFSALVSVNNFIWSYLAFILIVGVGAYFSFRSRFFQVRKFGAIARSFFSFFRDKRGNNQGIHPLKAFFAAIGGCIGIGNVVGIVTAVQIGGPGAMLWTWVGGLCGMVIQYAEVYLGLLYRVKNTVGSYDGGPMYFLPKAYKGQWIGPIICVLLCIYGVEIFMFSVMTDSIALNWEIAPIWIVIALLIATFGVALGGINRVGDVCSALIPLFVISYMAMIIYVLYIHAADLPGVIREIFTGAFTAQAAKGGFAGSSVALAISMGLSRGAYSGDIGIGYTSVIHAESRTTQFGRQSSLTIIGIFLDTFVICTLTILLVLTTGQWHSGIDASLMVQESLGLYFPYMHFFMPFFLFLLGYTTVLAYFVVGIKCAKFLWPKWGPSLYYLYASIALPLFAFVDSSRAFVIMSLSGALLLVFNLIGMFLLRKEVVYLLEE